MNNRGQMILRDKATKAIVKENATLVDGRGDTWRVTGWQAPRQATGMNVGVSGRVFVIPADQFSNAMNRAFFPHVFNLELVKQ